MACRSSGRGTCQALCAKQRIHGRVVPDEIAVLLARRVEPGVKFLLRARSRQHADVFRQPGVEGQRQLADGHFEFGAGHLKMRDHAERMNAGVRAAGTVSVGRLGNNFASASSTFCWTPVPIFCICQPS